MSFTEPTMKPAWWTAALAAIFGSIFYVITQDHISRPHYAAEMQFQRIGREMAVMEEKIKRGEREREALRQELKSLRR